MVQCPICLKYFKHINNMHLKSHKLTTKEFKILYPENNTCSEEFSKIRSESNRKQMLEIHNSSSEEYLKLRYKNIGVGRKVAWDNCPPERRKILIDECYKPLIDYNNNPENKAKNIKKLQIHLKIIIKIWILKLK